MSYMTRKSLLDQDQPPTRAPPKRQSRDDTSSEISPSSSSSSNEDKDDAAWTSKTDKLVIEQTWTGKKGGKSKKGKKGMKGKKNDDSRGEVIEKKKGKGTRITKSKVERSKAKTAIADDGAKEEEEEEEEEEDYKVITNKKRRTSAKSDCSSKSTSKFRSVSATVSAPEKNKSKSKLKSQLDDEDEDHSESEVEGQSPPASQKRKRIKSLLQPRLPSASGEEGVMDNERKESLDAVDMFENPSSSSAHHPYINPLESQTPLRTVVTPRKKCNQGRANGNVDVTRPRKTPKRSAGLPSRYQDSTTSDTSQSCRTKSAPKGKTNLKSRLKVKVRNEGGVVENDESEMKTKGKKRVRIDESLNTTKLILSTSSDPEPGLSIPGQSSPAEGLSDLIKALRYVPSDRAGSSQANATSIGKYTDLEISSDSDMDIDNDDDDDDDDHGKGCLIDGTNHSDAPLGISDTAQDQSKIDLESELTLSHNRIVELKGDHFTEDLAHGATRGTPHFDPLAQGARIVSVIAQQSEAEVITTIPSSSDRWPQPLKSPGSPTAEPIPSLEVEGIDLGTIHDAHKETGGWHRSQKTWLTDEIDPFLDEWRKPDFHLGNYMKENQQYTMASAEIIKLASPDRWQDFLDTCCSQHRIETREIRPAPTSEPTLIPTPISTTSGELRPAPGPQRICSYTPSPDSTPIFRRGPSSGPTQMIYPPIPSKVENYGEMQVTTFLPPSPLGSAVLPQPTPTPTPIPTFISRPDPNLHPRSNPTSFLVPYLPRTDLDRDLDLIPRPAWNLEYARGILFSQSRSPLPQHQPQLRTTDARSNDDQSSM